MANRNSRGASSRRDNWSAGVLDLARERPVAAAAVAAGAAAAGLFLWSKRSQISSQLSNLSDQIGEWTENMAGGSSSIMDDTAGLTSTSPTGSRSLAGSRTRATGTRSTTAKRSTAGVRGRGNTASLERAATETGGDANLGAQIGGPGTEPSGNS